jgi:hypothetical protein
MWLIAHKVILNYMTILGIHVEVWATLALLSSFLGPLKYIATSCLGSKPLRFFQTKINRFWLPAKNTQNKWSLESWMAKNHQNLLCSRRFTSHHGQVQRAPRLCKPQQDAIAQITAGSHLARRATGLSQLNMLHPWVYTYIYNIINTYMIWLYIPAYVLYIYMAMSQTLAPGGYPKIAGE